METNVANTTENKPCRRRWFQFSLRSLLIFVTLVAVVLGWRHQYQQMAEQSSEIVRLRQEVARLRVKMILAADVSDETKRRALSPYVKIGDDWADVAGRLGQFCDGTGHGPGFSDYCYTELGLEIHVYPDGEVYGVSYVVRLADGTQPRTSEWICCDDRTTWQKTACQRPRPANEDEAEAAYAQCLAALEPVAKQTTP